MDNHNRLLAALSTDEYARLTPQFGQTTLATGTVLERRGDTPTLVYFPGTASAR